VQFPYKNHIVFDKLKEIKSPIADGVVYLTRHGSKAYGTDVEGSDDDYKGIAIPPKQYYLGIGQRFDQQEFKDPDVVIYELRKFFTLLSNCNPNCIEVLFTDPADHIFVSKVGEKILENRQLFISKRVRWSFAGYSFSQLKRIKAHKKFLENPLLAPPTREQFNLPEKPLIEKNQLDATLAMVQKDMDRINFDWLSDLQEAEKIGIRNVMAEMMAEAKITSDDRWLSSARKSGFFKEKESFSGKRGNGNSLLHGSKIVTLKEQHLRLDSVMIVSMLTT
jgi:predicted nucleotidyltransferase